MGNSRNTGFINNIVKYDANGNVNIVSGSTTLLYISSSGAITTTGVISGSNALSASYAQTGTSASYAVSATSASYALNTTSASYAASATSASYAVVATTAITYKHLSYHSQPKGLYLLIINANGRYKPTNKSNRFMIISL